MRTLLLFRGSPASGKSTFIKEHNLEQYTLSADKIRLMYQSPKMDIDGRYIISCNNDKKVWKSLFHILEQRMSRGEFVVIDATNSKTQEMTRYKKIAEQYRYRIILIDMTDIPMEECIRRNKLRKPSYKVVPTKVIENQYARFKTQQIPSGIKVIKPNEFEEVIQFKPIDLSNYKRIHHIGDIHGCYTVLQEYLKDGIKDDEYYIFCGDYCDRGIENAKVINFLFEIMDKKNVLLLTGNHEYYLQKYANDEISNSKTFENKTKVEFDKSNIDKKKLRILYRKLGQLAYYIYNDKKVIVTHGGISRLPGNLMYIATEQFINGVGQYGDTKIINDTFLNNTEDNIYQIHAHRNLDNLPTQINKRCFCLEGKVEFGGCLRCVDLTKDGFETFEIKNNIFKIEDSPVVLKQEDNDYSIIDLLRNNKYINEKNFGNISSFNFSNTAFRKGIWDEQTVKARGLFFNVNTKDIVIRSYNKFFNIEENEMTQLSTLQRTLAFPVSVYKKYNGYLGLVGYDRETDELIIASKSSIEGRYVEWFREILNNKLKDNIDEFKEYIRNNNCTIVFEVIAPKKDTHIIEYNEDDIILLNIVLNDINFTQCNYANIIVFANRFKLHYKEECIILKNWDEFRQWYKDVTDEDYKYESEYIEGFVIEDSNLFTTKVKTEYYKFWKQMRKVVNEVSNKGYIRNTSILQTPLANEFYGWLRKQDSLDRNIIELRNEFIK